MVLVGSKPRNWIQFLEWIQFYEFPNNLLRVPTCFVKSSWSQLQHQQCHLSLLSLSLILKPNPATHLGSSKSPSQWVPKDPALLVSIQHVHILIFTIVLALYVSNCAICSIPEIFLVFLYFSYHILIMWFPHCDAFVGFCCSGNNLRFQIVFRLCWLVLN